MSLDDIRKDIDGIDFKVRELLMQRMDCSARVVGEKIADGNFIIYRADREEAILEKLGKGIPESRKAGYLAVVRKITETSRMYQYGILYEARPELFEKLLQGIDVPAHSAAITVVLTRPNIPNAMSSILSMIGDYGYNMDEMKLLHYSDDASEVTFELTLLGDIADERLKKLLFQLSMESVGFKIIQIRV